MTKKNLVGLGAVLSTLVSIFMWFWYSTLPSFDQTTTALDEEGVTWANFELKVNQEVNR